LAEWLDMWLAVRDDGVAGYPVGCIAGGVAGYDMWLAVRVTEWLAIRLAV